MIRAAIITAVFLALPVASASALSAAQVEACQAMAATLAPKQAEIAEMKEARDGLAARVEASGEAWQDAEVHRLVSPALARQADSAAADYAANKQKLAQTEAGMQGALVQYNRDVADYNKACATKK